MVFDLTTARPSQQPQAIVGFDISTAQPVQPQQVEAIQQQRVEALPELGGGGLLAGQDPAVGAAITPALLTTTNPVETGNILTSSFPGVIGVTQTKEGEFIATNNETGVRVSLNKPGLSQLDIVQGLGIAAAFTPAARAAVIPGAIARRAGTGAVAAGATQAVIEAGQTQAGGQFDPGEVALAAGLGGAAELAAPLVAPAARAVGRAVRGAGQAVARTAGDVSQLAKETAARIQRPQLLDVNTGLPTPAFSKALESKGLTVDNLIDGIPDLPDDVTPSQAVNLVIKDKLLTGAKDDALAPFKLSRIGAVEADNAAVEAVRQGFQQGDVQAAKTASEATKVGMRDMLKKTRQIKANSSLAKKFRPTDVVGTSVMKRFTHIRESASTARLELDNIAKTQLKGTAIDVDGVRNNFLSEMDRLDVGVDTSTIPPKLDFEGSLISKDRTSQRVIKDVVDLLSEKRVPDALRAHKLKRQLDNLIDFRKKAVGGLTEAGRNVAKSLRKSLNDSIRDVSDEYAAVNDILSESIGSLDDFQRVLGPSIDVFKEGAEKAIGQDLRGLLSNRKSRVRLENSVNNLDATAKNLGGQFNDDISDLVSFAEVLDDQFGAIAKTGFKGQVGSAVRQAARGREGIKEAVIERGAEAIEKARGINEQNAFKAMQELLKGQ